MASEPAIGTAIVLTKLFVTIKVTLVFFRFLTSNHLSLDFLIIITCKLTEINSQSFCKYGYYWAAFLLLSKDVKYNTKGKLISSYVLCFFNESTGITVALHIFPPKMVR